MPSPSYPSSSSRSLRFSLRGGGTSNRISRSTSTSTSTSSITITIVAIVVTASLLLVLSTINMNDTYSETNSHYYDILMYGGRAATGNGLRLSLSSKSSSSSSSSIISPPSTCWIKIVGQCHHFPSLSNSEWFDDYMKGGPVASTEELCKIRQQNWESSCSLSEEEKLEEEKQEKKKKQRQKQKGSNNDVDTSSNIVKNSDRDDVPVQILMKFGASPRQS